MRLEFNILLVSPDIAETSLEQDFMFYFHSYLPNCVAGKIPHKPNKCKVN